MTSLVQHNSLFEIDRELDVLLDEIQEQAEDEGTDQVAPALIERFEAFCQAYGEKVDRITAGEKAPHIDFRPRFRFQTRRSSE